MEGSATDPPGGGERTSDLPGGWRPTGKQRRQLARFWSLAQAGFYQDLHRFVTKKVDDPVLLTICVVGAGGVRT